MEENKASMTAKVTTYGRAYHSLYDNPKIFDDFLAPKILTDEEFSEISKHMAGGIKFFNPEEAHLYEDIEAALKWVTQTQVAPTSLARSRYTEDMLENAIKLGVEQYVILGAGFDTFAFRKPQLLNQIKVFEIDHPATQAMKIERIKELKWNISPSLNFVPVDFSKDDFIEMLLNSDYSPNKLTFFSWLGVTYYLTKEDILKTLKAIARISTKGSSIVFDYLDNDAINNENTAKRVRDMIKLAESAGEPMKSFFEYLELEDYLQQAGFNIYEHLNPLEIEDKFFKERSDYYHAFENINYVLAVLQNGNI